VLTCNNDLLFFLCLIGIIPLVAIGGLGYFNIGETVVTFAASSVPGVGNAADVRAFVGVATEVLQMVSAVLADPAAAFSPAAEMDLLLQRYIATHATTVAVDIVCSLFDFRRVDDPTTAWELARLRANSQHSTPPRSDKQYFDVTTFAHLSKNPDQYAEVVVAMMCVYICIVQNCCYCDFGLFCK
jgi:hypothetical protein